MSGSTSNPLPFPVDDVLTHDQLADEVGGLEELSNILPVSRKNQSQTDRENALRDVLSTLAIRTPPIFPENLAKRTDLCRAVLWGTLERLYRYSMTSGSDVFATLQKTFERKFQAEMLGMQPEINVGVRGNASTIAVSRR